MNQEKLHQSIATFMTILFLCSMVLLSRETALYVSGRMAEQKAVTVVIDSGHGGIDPGKIAADGTLEKDINLAIALKLQQYLEAADITVIMTRTSDDGLYDPDVPNKKVQDMKNRVNIINEADAKLAVSIHQNSYSDSASHGAQIFYYTNGDSAKTLADTLQNVLVKDLDPDNHRQAKSNDSYYLLKKTTCPTVIVECGFMSNPNEAALLSSVSYQDRVAWVLHLGILQYLNQQGISKSFLG